MPDPSGPPPRDERLAGYRRAQVVFTRPDGGRLTVRPAARPGPYPCGASPVHVLTAHNPGPERPGDAENRRRQRALEADLAAAGLTVVRAVASAPDGTHAEESAAVVGWDDAAALALARRHGQDALFRWSAEAWEVVPCDGGPPLRSGWTVERG
ncbi:DUF3293 domain-containing protein [Actinomycetospora sp. TBRC 11914]|uniref:DUF3293 domain-containing protein n=1 Tax=Actinomycetospora sp. TBRC 11914 TaxID=2729387 RepID=UPI00145F1FB5|nr:DUF3293 domain-containing protein [Actinomycetospora sp. TBRC 11914]NMO91989.1 DUF3293 domain-containing protein [Actinomycetospora sp. TBRC 11914]